jgi:hypothetical protein
VLLAGAGVLAYLEGWAAAVVLATGAMAVLVLVTDRGAPSTSVEAASLGGVEALARLCRDLGVAGHGVLVPPSAEGGVTRLFVPAGDVASVEELPPLADDVVVHRSRPGVLGIALAPPGRGLETEWLRLKGPLVGQGREEAASHVRSALEALGLGAEVRVEGSKGRVRVAWRHLVFEEACRRSRTDWSPWHVQGGCPACSFVGILVARSFARPVRVVECSEDGRVVRLALEVVPRSSR